MLKRPEREIMKKGDRVKYAFGGEFVGVIVEIGSNMLKVAWDGHATEWMPRYALEAIGAFPEPKEVIDENR